MDWLKEEDGWEEERGWIGRRKVMDWMKEDDGLDEGR